MFCHHDPFLLVTQPVLVGRQEACVTFLPEHVLPWRICARLDGYVIQ